MLNCRFLKGVNEVCKTIWYIVTIDLHFEASQLTSYDKAWGANKKLTDTRKL